MSSWRAADYTCPQGHGTFDALVARDEVHNPQPCPECGAPSPMEFPAPMGRCEAVTIFRGKSDPPAKPTYLNTSAMADGMSRSEFKKHRKHVWQEHRKAQVRKAVS